MTSLDLSYTFGSLSPATNAVHLFTKETEAPSYVSVAETRTKVS